MEFKPPVELSFTDNISENWKSWKQKLFNYLLATEKSGKEDKIKVAILLNLIGDEGLAVFNTFGLDTDKLKFATLIQCFDDYCKDKKNVLFERYKFFKTLRIEGQSIENYVTVLRTVGLNCEFDNQLDNLIRDQIVLHLKDQGLQERILRESEIDLAKVIDFVKASETTKEQVKVIQGNGVELHGLKEDKCVDNIHAGKSYKNSTSYKKNSDVMKLNDKSKFGDNTDNNNSSYVCKKCGIRHMANKCPAFGKNCNTCGKPNHFSVGCYKNRYRVSVIEENSDVETEYMNSLIECCKIGGNSEHKYSIDQLQWSQVLLINKKDIEFKLDTGAEINVMPMSQLIKIGFDKRKLNTSRQLVLEVFGGNKLKSAGLVTLRCYVNEIKQADLSFVVVDDTNNTKVKPLLGLEGCIKLNLIKRVNGIVTNNIDKMDKMEFLKQNSDMFQGTGLIKNYECRIKIDKTIQPVVRPPRRVPLSIKERLKDKLELLEKGEIIEKSDGPFEWLSNLVVVEKTDGNLRVCLDPTDLNKAIMKTPALIPTLPEITAQLSGKCWFTVLDLKEGYYNVKLDKESSRLCAFSTPFGCYKFLRLPFGVSNAPEEFQRVNSSIFAGINGLIIYFDDLLIAAQSEKEHDLIVEKVMERARQHNIRFNPNKLQYKTHDVHFLGFQFDKTGIRIDPARIKAIQALDDPKNKKELQRLLGMLNYIRTFIPTFADLTTPLRALLRSDVDFVWTKTHSMLLDNIKEIITNAPVLAHFDSSKMTTIECDASKDALGCCLMQEGQPISYASRALTPTEQNFAQIEKELLSLMFAVSKFHIYIYGRKTIVRTDHKPLVSIIKKSVGQITSHRLQRMVLKLIKYDLELIHVPGKNLYIADLLSRNFCKEIEHEEDYLSEVVHEVKTNDYQLQVTERRKLILEEETAKDWVLQQLATFYMEGWPEDKKYVPEELKIYYKLKNEIHVAGKLVFMGKRLIVPFSLRKEMLEKLHNPHLGISKTIARARQVFYWPNINSEIEEYILKCRICEKYRNNNIKEPLIPYQVPTRPYQRVGIDFFQFGNHSYLIIVDYLSTWFDIIKMRSQTSVETIKVVKSIFSTHGIPSEIIADNMPFNSLEFHKFCKSWDIKIINTSPHYPKANGMVEKSVGIAKNLLRKCALSGQDFELALIEYRNCPVTGLRASPAQILMSRQLRTLVPVIEEHLTPNIVEVSEDKCKVNHKKKMWYDKTAKQRQGFVQGEDVVYRRGRTWEPALIITRRDTPRSYVIKNEEGREMVRNSVHLRRSKGEFVEHPINDGPLLTQFKNEDDSSNVSSSPTQHMEPSKCSSPAKSRETAVEKQEVRSRYGRKIKPPKRLVELE